MNIGLDFFLEVAFEFISMIYLKKNNIKIFLATFFPKYIPLKCWMKLLKIFCPKLTNKNIDSAYKIKN